MAFHFERRHSSPRAIAAFAAFAAITVRAEGLQDLSWMAGSWMERKGATDTEEHWLAPKGGLMIAVNRTVTEGKAPEFEWLRIEMKDGKPVYLASPGGRPATEFRAIEQSAAKVVFENAAHDFPQRVLYWREGDALMARIEGTIRGQARSRQWRFERMK
ncbi:MAG: hypothetical protein H7Y14_05540 [Burkholderiales bacterium]|nr:hypothetical protein [Burkholderiales bacterium]